jgi:hypothetical protein
LILILMLITDAEVDRWWWCWSPIADADRQLLIVDADTDHWLLILMLIIDHFLHSLLTLTCSNSRGSSSSLEA